MNQPFTRADVALIGTAATATGVSNAVRIAAMQSGEIGPAADVAVRFLEQPVARFIWEGDQVFLTPTDLIAIISTSVLLIRFLVWVLAPMVRAVWRLLYGRKEKD